MTARAQLYDGAILYGVTIVPLPTPEVILYAEDVYVVRSYLHYQKCTKVHRVVSGVERHLDIPKKPLAPSVRR